MFASVKEKKKSHLKIPRKPTKENGIQNQPNKMDTIANTIPVYNSKYTMK